VTHMGLRPMRFLPATRVKGEDLRECGIVAGRRTSQCRQCAKNGSGSVVRVRACCLEFAAPIVAGHSDGRIDWATGCTVDGHTAPRGYGARVARDEPGLSERTRMALVLTLSVGQRLTTDSPDRAHRRLKIGLEECSLAACHSKRTGPRLLASRRYFWR
jgi:hypothetical protein